MTFPVAQSIDTLAGRTSTAPFLTQVFARAPTGNDMGYLCGQRWVDTSDEHAEWFLLNFISSNGVVQANWVLLSSGAETTESLTGNSGGPVEPTAGNINLLGTTLYDVIGNPATSTLTITPGSNAFPITPFVVGPIGNAGYQTIQSALDAAHSAGNRNPVYIQPGSYSENLVLYPDSQLVGTPASSVLPGQLDTVNLTGTHTPPTTGFVTFNNIFLISATNIFDSAAAGTSTILLQNGSLEITNGYLFNLPNWVSPGAMAAIQVISRGTDYGIVNNTGGALVFFEDSFLGSGTTNPTICSGTAFINSCQINCPLSLLSGTQLSSDKSIFYRNITFNGNSAAGFDTCKFSTGGDPAITQSSSSNIQIVNSIIQSSNNPAISGAGAGTVILGGISFENDTHIAGTLTTTGTAGFLPAQFGTTGQVFTSNGPGIIPSFQNSSGSDLHVAKFIVSAGGVPSGANFTTIASAIAAASSGDTIYLSDGTYTENLTLKDGVNLVSLNSFSAYAMNQQLNVTIIGKMIDGGSAVKCNFTGIAFQTNSDFVISLTGASTCSFFACYFNGLDNTIFNSTNASARINVDNCYGNLATTGIAYFSFSDGTIFFDACTFNNTGSSLTASSISSGSAFFAYCQVNAAVQSTGTAGLTALWTQFFTGNLNITAVTMNGTQPNASALGHSFIASGTASALSIGAGVTCDVYTTTVQSSNTNVFTGAGTINTGGNVCLNSSGNNVSTINHLTVI